MESFKKSNLFKNLLAAFGISGAALFGFYLFKRMKKKLPCNTYSGLSKDEAIRRSQIIKNLKYSFFLQLNPAHLKKEHMNYEGSVLIEFDIEKEEDLFLDFEGKVLKILNNGKQINATHVNGKIYIKAADLSKKNKINVTYVNNYSTESAGIKMHYEVGEMGEIVNLFLI
jgi:hypothetical protein